MLRHGPPGHNGAGHSPCCRCRRRGRPACRRQPRCYPSRCGIPALQALQDRGSAVVLQLLLSLLFKHLGHPMRAPAPTHLQNHHRRRVTRLGCCTAGVAPAAAAASVPPACLNQAKRQGEVLPKLCETGASCRSCCAGCEHKWTYVKSRDVGTDTDRRREQSPSQHWVHSAQQDCTTAAAALQRRSLPAAAPEPLPGTSQQAQAAAAAMADGAPLQIKIRAQASLLGASCAQQCRQRSPARRAIW